MQRIVFICGSVAPGKDGVGDYTIKLASELMINGFETAIVALNDTHITSLESYTQNVDGIEIPVLRIPSNLSQKTQITKAIIWIYKIDPDWLSFQYVPFSFHHKGLPTLLAKRLSKINSKYAWHIMYHELWLGESSESTWKDRILGFVQKQIVLKLNRSLNVKQVTVTNDYYLKCLGSIGIDALKIPVFSNLPEVDGDADVICGFLPAEVTANRDDYIIGSFFGRVNYFNGFYDQMLALVQLLKPLNKKIIFTHIGRHASINSIVEGLKTFGIDLHLLGERSEEHIASYLSQIDYGISTYPKILYEKSGTIAAMIDNGLPVVLLKKSFEKDNVVINEVKYISEIKDFRKFLIDGNTINTSYNLKNVCGEYMKIFENNS